MWKKIYTMSPANLSHIGIQVDGVRGLCGDCAIAREVWMFGSLKLSIQGKHKIVI